MSPRTRREGARSPLAYLLAVMLALGVVVAGCGSDEEEGSGSSGQTAQNNSQEKIKVGVSNTLVGNGWREEMICSVKAQAAASGRVSEVLVHNVNGGAPEQIAGIRNLISSGAKVIVINPADRKALNSVIKEADRRGIVVVAVDQAVDAPEALVVTNDQVAYGRLGAEWLAEQIGGKGNVVEMRGIKGVPADEDRHKGFMEGLAKYPDVKVVKEVFTGWQFAPGGKQTLELLNANTKIDGIWTSGIDYTVVNAFKTANKDYVPVVGADTNEFLNQMMQLQDEGFVGAAVTNPATIGAVGLEVGLRKLDGKDVPRETTLTPEVWDMKEAADTVKANYDKSLPPTYSSQMTVEGYTKYEPAALKSCKGPSA